MVLQPIPKFGASSHVFDDIICKPPTGVEAMKFVEERKRRARDTDFFRGIRSACWYHFLLCKQESHSLENLNSSLKVGSHPPTPKKQGLYQSFQICNC